jgi:hypothetical protein
MGPFSLADTKTICSPGFGLMLVIVAGKENMEHGWVNAGWNEFLPDMTKEGLKHFYFLGCGVARENKLNFLPA